MDKVKWIRNPLHMTTALFNQYYHVASHFFYPWKQYSFRQVLWCWKRGRVIATVVQITVSDFWLIGYFWLSRYRANMHTHLQLQIAECSFYLCMQTFFLWPSISPPWMSYGCAPYGETRPRVKPKPTSWNLAGKFAKWHLLTCGCVELKVQGIWLHRKFSSSHWQSQGLTAVYRSEKCHGWN